MTPCATSAFSPDRHSRAQRQRKYLYCDSALSYNGVSASLVYTLWRENHDYSIRQRWPTESALNCPGSRGALPRSGTNRSEMDSTRDQPTEGAPCRRRLAHPHRGSARVYAHSRPRSDSHPEIPQPAKSTKAAAPGSDHVRAPNSIELGAFAHGVAESRLRTATRHKSARTPQNTSASLRSPANASVIVCHRFVDGDGFNARSTH